MTETDQDNSGALQGLCLCTLSIKHQAQLVKITLLFPKAADSVGAFEFSVVSNGLKYLFLFTLQWTD